MRIRVLISSLSVLALCLVSYGSEPTELIVESPSAPRITLRNVQYQRHSDTLGDLSELRAVLSDDGNSHWMEISFEVEFTLRNGKTVSFRAGGKREPGGDSFEVYGFLQPDAAYAPREVIGHRVSLIEGSVVEMKKVRGYSGLVAADESCYRDLVKVANLSGIAQRRALSELIRLRCIDTIEERMQVVSQRPVRGLQGAVNVVLSPDAYSSHEGVIGIVPAQKIFEQPMIIKQVYCGPVQAGQLDCPIGANN